MLIKNHKNALECIVYKFQKCETFFVVGRGIIDCIRIPHRATQRISHRVIEGNAIFKHSTLTGLTQNFGNKRHLILDFYDFNKFRFKVNYYCQTLFCENKQKLMNLVQYLEINYFDMI